jgi:hypothetical protein
MREDSSRGFDDVLEAFEAVAQNLDTMLARNAADGNDPEVVARIEADGNDPEVVARIERAKAISLRATEVVRQHVDQSPIDRIQMTG